MPIKSMASRFGVFMPSDLDLLQSVYDEATEGMTAVDDATMAEVASGLFQAHQSGVKDRQELLGTASRALYRPTA
jgi:hypothetical protein